MACDKKIYANTDVTINVSFASGCNDPEVVLLDLSDIQSMTATFTSIRSGRSFTLRSEDGRIDISSLPIKFLIPKENAATERGRYTLKIIFVDQLGKEHGVTPSKSSIQFH